MKAFGDRDCHFLQIKGFIEDPNTAFADIPDYSQVSRNLVSMSNFLPILEPLIQSRHPKKICEIGAYRGITTRALLEVATRAEAQLHVVDPAPDFRERMPETDTLIHHQAISSEFLSTARDIDIFFVDGDHNYEVVEEELRLMAENTGNGSSPLVFMHDVGWPWGRRDLYYDTRRVKAPKSLQENDQIVLIDADEFEVSLPVEQAFAATEGGERNGVLCAIEDFLAARPDWKMIWIPSLFGLGILFDRENSNQELLGELDELSMRLQAFRPFLATLEFNRVLLLSELDKQGKEWDKNQSHIFFLNNTIESMQNMMQDMREEVAQLRTVLGWIRYKFSNARKSQ